MIEATAARPIRSFVRREGRLTLAQLRALEQLLPAWGISYAPTELDLAAAFGRTAPCVLEIGFGNGHALTQLAAAQPDANFLGIEVHRPGVGQLLNTIADRKLGNVRVICHDAVEVLREQLPPDSLDGVNIFFPDPWPKKRHHKRRLIQPPFLDLLARRMKPRARLHIATDWGDYARHITECLDASDEFRHVEAIHTDADPGGRPQTKFELRGLHLGHDVWDMIYQRH